MAHGEVTTVVGVCIAPLSVTETYLHIYNRVLDLQNGVYQSNPSRSSLQPNRTIRLDLYLHYLRMAFADVFSLILSVFGQLAPWHLLSYSALLGMELYQTFVVTKVAHVFLPQSAFHTLQKRIFPIYFRAQTALVVLTAISVPALGPRSLAQNKADWIPFAVAGATAVLNMTMYGPRTSKLMVDRVHQSTCFEALVRRCGASLTLIFI